MTLILSPEIQMSANNDAPQDFFEVKYTSNFSSGATATRRVSAGTTVRELFLATHDTSFATADVTYRIGGVSRIPSTTLREGDEVSFNPKKIAGNGMTE